MPGLSWENLKVVSRVDFADDKFRPQEIYVDKQHLVVIGQYAQDGPIRIMEDANALIYPPIPQRQTVKAIVFNIENKEQPKKSGK